MKKPIFWLTLAAFIVAAYLVHYGLAFYGAR
jgi:hypothetical protein